MQSFPQICFCPPMVEAIPTLPGIPAPAFFLRRNIFFSLWQSSGRQYGSDWRQLRSRQPAPTTKLRAETPFLTAEVGGGNQDTYHRRPVLAVGDVAATIPVMIGSGVNLLGYYMYQGGENPDGKLTTLQESQRTGYPTDVPVKGYDFQAPLGEFGQMNATLRELKLDHYFLQDFGAQLASERVIAPTPRPAGPADTSI